MRIESLLISIAHILVFLFVVIKTVEVSIVFVWLPQTHLQTII
ncbi:hypothetical protein [Staphylococcus schleiferi]|nr:hypothetical protein [Staphylococcus schleiferi]